MTIYGKLGTTGEARPFQLGVFETGVTELVGKDEKVDQNDYGGSVPITVHGSGELLSFLFIATEEGDGAVQDSAGTLFILDADPAVSAGDTALALAEHQSVIGKVDVAAGDWSTDANGGTAFECCQPVPFHEAENLWLVWLQTDATGLNDVAGDDEVLEVNIWFRLDHRV